MRLELSATEPQAAYHQLTHRYRAFVGGFGTGKTQTLLDAAMIDALGSSKAIVGIYEPTHDLIRMIIVPRLLNRLNEMGIPHRYNQQHGAIYTSNSRVGDFVLRSLDNPERIVGYETYCSHIDELDTLKQDHAEHAFRQIDARNRQVIMHNGRERENRIGVYTTPEGFKFVYDRWVRNKTDRYGMVQASSRSNPFLPAGYIDNLMENYPESLREAYIDGVFVNLTAGTVYASFDIELNNCTTTIKDVGISADVHVGLDFNVGNMSAVVMVKVNDEYHVIAEHLGVLDTPTMAQLLVDTYPGRVIKVYPDASGNHRSTQNGQSTDIMILERHGLRVYVDGQNPRVKDRVNCLNGALLNMSGNRRLKINTKVCRGVTDNLIRQAWKNGEPDKTSGNDHTNDALGYAVCRLIPMVATNTTKLMRFQ